MEQMGVSECTVFPEKSVSASTILIRETVTTGLLGNS